MSILKDFLEGLRNNSKEKVPVGSCSGAEKENGEREREKKKTPYQAYKKQKKKKMQRRRSREVLGGDFRFCRGIAVESAGILREHFFPEGISLCSDMNKCVNH